MSIVAYASAAALIILNAILLYNVFTDILR